MFAGLLASWLVAGRLVASANRPIGNPPDRFATEDISLQSRSGCEIKGWLVPVSDPKAVIVLVHGIRASRATMLPRASFLKDAGYAVVMIDLQAHGESLADQITLGHLERHDATAAIRFSRERFPGLPVGAIGVSLGGASLLLSDAKVDTLVLESVFSNIDTAVRNRVAAMLGPLAFIPAETLLMQLGPRLGISRDELRPADKLPDLQCPVFMISGVDDPHTTADETETMFGRAKSPAQLWLVPEAAHVDIHGFTQSEYETRVLEFLGTHLIDSPDAE